MLDFLKSTINWLTAPEKLISIATVLFLLMFMKLRWFARKETFAGLMALLAGRFVGEATLLRFYVLHCIAFPFIVVILIAVHFWRVRKVGGISGPATV